MRTLEENALFRELLKRVRHKASHDDQVTRITESEAKIIAAAIHRSTGETISTKTLINYFRAAYTGSWTGVNPSLLTLDILSRYCLDDNPVEQGHLDPIEGSYWIRFKQLTDSPGRNESTFTLDTKKYNLNKKITLGAAILGLFCITFFYIFFKNHRLSQDFFDDFSNVSMEYLESRGWKILFEDKVWLNKQESKNHLTLYTLAGDYWVKAGEKQAVTNTLVRQLDHPNKFSVAINISQFCPIHSYQQAGIILFEKDLDPKRSLRITWGYNNQGDLGIPGLNVTVIEMIGQQPITHYYHEYISDYINQSNQYEHPSGPLGLMIQFNNNNISLYGYKESRLNTFTYVTTFNTNIKPRYCGVVAFHGWTDSRYMPLHADTIPVLIDDFKITYSN